MSLKNLKHLVGTAGILSACGTVSAWGCSDSCSGTCSDGCTSGCLPGCQNTCVNRCTSSMMA